MNNDQKTAEPKSFKLWLKIIWLKLEGLDLHTFGFGKEKQVGF